MWLRMIENTVRDENYAGGRRNISLGFLLRTTFIVTQPNLYEVTLVIALGGPTFVSRGTSPSCLMGQVGTRNEPHLYNGGVPLSTDLQPPGQHNINRFTDAFPRGYSRNEWVPQGRGKAGVPDD